jgi:mono/diheme cytochrome c family protein
MDSLMIRSMRVSWLSLLMGFYGSSFLEAAEPPNGLAAIAVVAEGNCVACHEAPDVWRPLLPLKPASDLSGVGSRLSSTSLRRYLGPGGVDQAGVHDPVVLGGGLLDDETRDALVAYLSSLREEAPEMVEGDAGRGRALYHSIGCVACHEPEAGIGGAGPSDGSNRKPLMTPSVPIMLAKEYAGGMLAQFLRNPLAYRPAGRMPSFHLSPSEAADLAFFLQGESKIPASCRISSFTRNPWQRS